MWPDSADAVIGGDQAVVFATVTPARGVILTPLTNFGIRDRDRGTIEPVNTSIGVWKKLERLQRNPRVAVAYHSRTHSLTDRPEFVLVQGTATFTPLDDRGYLDAIGETWDRFAGEKSRRAGPLWRWWLDVWHWRVGITIDVERVVVWPDLACGGEPQVHGTPLPAAPEPQSPTRRGTGPRVDHERLARRIGRLPHAVLGWTGADGFPVVVPVRGARATPRGVALDVPDALVPPGGRRAGLTAHWFARHVIGQEQRVHTGWLEHGPDGVLYAPHTEAGYRFPTSWFVYRLVAGGYTRLGLRSGRRAGFLPH